MSDRRVVVSAASIVSPYGLGLESFWQGIISGKSAVRPVSAFDCSQLNRNRAAEVLEVPVSQKRRIDRFIEICSEQLKADGIAKVDGVAMATGLGNQIGLLDAMERRIKKGVKEGEPPIALSDTMTQLAEMFSASGPSMMMTSACAASNYAIGYGFDVIRRGLASTFVCGGAELVSITAFAGFCRLNAMATDECRPFDLNRKGMITSEGAGLIVLEELTHAIERGATILCELAGYGIGCDTYHITAPDPSGQAMAKVITRALENSSIEPSAVSYVCSHGTGTLGNDVAESRAIKTALGKHAGNIPVNSIKSSIGHTGGAASVMETIACLLSIENGSIPPTINYITPDPECDLDYVPNRARPAEIDVVLNNSFAFGGSGACLVLRRYDGE